MRIAIVVGTLLASTLAMADDEPPPAAKLFVEGRALLDAGKPAEACKKFEESLKLDAKAAGTKLNLGLCHEASGKLATAIAWFRRAQTTAAEAGLAEIEVLAKDRSQALAPRIATIKITISAPAGAIVLLDGAKVDDVDFGRLEIDAGHHTLELSAPNAPTTKKEIEVVDGTAATVTLETRPFPPKQKTYEIVDLGKPMRSRSNLYAGLGIGLVVASGAIGGLGKVLHDGGETPDDFHLWKNVVRYGGTSLFVVGAAAVTYAVVLRKRAPKKERREVVAPVITRDSVGFTLAKPF